MGKHGAGSELALWTPAAVKDISGRIGSVCVYVVYDSNELYHFSLNETKIHNSMLIYIWYIWERFNYTHRREKINCIEAKWQLLTKGMMYLNYNGY